jgi:hypothetical protein
MSYLEISNKLAKQFKENFQLNLFQKGSTGHYNLIAMNSGTNGPYKLPRELKGVSVGIAFQHETGTSIEVYFKTNFYNDYKRANPTFDVFSKHYGGRKLHTETKVIIAGNGNFHLFLLPIDQLESIEEACHILNSICLDLNGTPRI